MTTDPNTCMACGHTTKTTHRTALECPCKCHDALRVVWRGTKP